LPWPLERAADDRELLGRVVGFCAQTLRESPEALGYLGRRGRRSPELVERFRLGYANRTLGYRLPVKNLRAGAQLRGRLQRLGVLRESGHEHLSGSLVIPVLDQAGDPVQLYGRKITRNLRPGTPLHLYVMNATAERRTRTPNVHWFALAFAALALVFTLAAAVLAGQALAAPRPPRDRG
jgi:DNA primase